MDDDSALQQGQSYPTNIDRSSTYANNALGTNQLDELVCDRTLGIALSVGLEVSEVAYVTVLIVGTTVCLSVWVDCCIFLSDLHSTCSLMEAGLQWGPADVQPLVLSPNWWTCMPRLALASWPVMFHEMVVGEDSEACSKVTVPVIFESPRMNATTQGTRSSARARTKQRNNQRHRWAVSSEMLARNRFRGCPSR